VTPEPPEEDQSAIVMEAIRARITPEQHGLLCRLWDGGDHLGWVTAKALLHRRPPAETRRALEGLGGSLVTEATGGMDESYVLRLLGALASERGRAFEDVLARYLAYSVKRYEDDAGVKEITQAEVERDLGITEPLLSAIYRLAMMALPSLANGGSGPPNWKLNVMRDIHDLTDVKDWHRFVREHALKGYDPAEPVRAAARDQYLARRQASTQARVDLPEFWLPNQFRVFISHVAQHKAEASALQAALHEFHVTGFVAHVDIEPTKEWEDEILFALRSAEALVALLTQDFHSSKWTDQEVGFVMGRAKLVVSVQLDDVAPYGFIGRGQAVNGKGRTPEQLARSLFGALARHETTRQSVAEAVVSGFARSAMPSAAEENAAMLGDLTYMDVELAAQIRAAYVSNTHIRSSAAARERAEGALRKWSL